jgi:TonB family protein
MIASIRFWVIVICLAYSPVFADSLAHAIYAKAQKLALAGNYKSALSNIRKALQIKISESDKILFLKLQADIATKTKDGVLKVQTFEELLLAQKEYSADWENTLYDYYVYLVHEGRTKDIWHLMLRHSSSKFRQNFYGDPEKPFEKMPPLALELPMPERLYYISCKMPVVAAKPVEDVYTIYRRACFNKLAENWTCHKEEKQPYVRLKLDKSGKCLSAEIIDSSGSYNLDNEALKIIKDITFPNFPPRLKAETCNMSFHLHSVIGYLQKKKEEKERALKSNPPLWTRLKPD